MLWDFWLVVVGICGHLLTLPRAHHLTAESRLTYVDLSGSPRVEFCVSVMEVAGQLGSAYMWLMQVPGLMKAEAVGHCIG